MKKIVVVYHEDCLDGFCSAWVAWKKFGNKADYIPANYGSPIPKGIKGKSVYTLDFCYSDKDIKKIKKLAKKLIVIDHHISKELSVKLANENVFDIKHSGCVLSWFYFFPNKKTPLLCRYVESQDLWNFKMPDSIKINRVLGTLGSDFNKWSEVYRNLENKKKRKEIIKKGTIMNDYNRTIAEKIINNNLQLVSFLGHKVYAVNAPHYFSSFIANTLAKKKPPFAISWEEDKDSLHVSLRADNTKDLIDLPKLVKRFGGGGHKAAVSFRLPIGSKLPWKVLKSKNGR